jgi:hypothetical protein
VPDGLLQLPARLRDQVVREIQPGESVVWTARPLPRLFRRQAIGHVLFGIVWLSLILGGAVAVFRFQPWHQPVEWGLIVPLVVVGGPFLFIGCLCLYSPFLINKRAKLTVYVLTDRRAMVFSCGDAIGTVKMTLQSYGPDMLQYIETRERPDGSGDLILEPLPIMPGTHVIWTPRHGFIAIEKVRQIETLVRKTFRANGAQHVTVLPNRFRKPSRYRL